MEQSVTYRVSPTKRYVCGFAFSEGKKHVLLIRKQRPEWQRGKFNGIGGHVEPFDTTFRSAMTREFAEESGLSIAATHWDPFITIGGEGWEVHFFRVFGIKIYMAKTMTDEEVQIIRVDDLPSLAAMCLPNLQWLIPMALVENETAPGEGSQWIATP